MVGLAVGCLWAGLIAAVVTAVAAPWPRLARPAAIVMAAGLTVSTVVLGRALWTLDLSLTYVADHARGGLSGPYRLAGLWGGASGSLLLFTAMVGAVAACLICAKSGQVRPGAKRWAGSTVAGLTAAVLATANPFDRLAVPAIEGGGLQPILEHPAMLYHPPLLYLGQVSTLVPFALVLGARGDLRWRRALRAWLGTSLALLTAGLATGANWAYVELGWGGYWGWDPVENGVLVSWLLVIAGLHALRQPGHDRAVRLLCGLPWVAVLIGSAVTRQGVGGSVHSFADDGRVAWVLFGLILATAAVLLASLGTDAPGEPRRLRLPVMAAGLATSAAVLVLAGVLYPIPAAGEPLVSGHYYATLVGPLAIAALAGSAFALGRCPIGWSTAAALAAVGLASAVGARSGFALWTAAGLGVILVNLGVGLRRSATKRPAMLLGHVGLAVLLVGVAGSTQAEEANVRLAVGEEISIGGHELRHLGVEVVDGPIDDSAAVQSTVEVRRGGEVVAVLHPALVSFPERSVLLAETALHSRPLRDLQVVLSDANDAGAALYRIGVRPLVMWVWWGSLLIVASGIAIAADAMRARSVALARQRRIEAPAELAAADQSSGGERSF